jgi:hypothetical protein
VFGVVSYPRSGNHLARFFVEFLTSKATQGSMGTVGDHALAINEYPGDPDVLAHVDLGDIIATKAHSVKEINNLRGTFLVEFNAYLLIIRNPVDCILGNLRIAELDSESLVENIDAEFDLWQRLLIRMIKTPTKVEIVSYSDLVSESEDSKNSVLSSYVNLFGEDIVESNFAKLNSDYSAIRALSAGAKGRTWNGVRSLNKGPLFYLRKLDSGLQSVAQSRFLDRMDPSGIRGKPPDSLDFELDLNKFPRGKKVREIVALWHDELSKFEVR